MGTTNKKTFARIRTFTLGACFLLLSGFAAEAADRIIKLNIGTPPGHPYNVGAEAFKKAVEDKSGGSIEVQIFPSAQLGGEVESVKNLQLGTLEATIVSTSNLSSFYESYQAFSVPYLFKSVECSFAVMDSDVGKSFADTLLERASLRVLGYPTFGARHLFNSVRPVKSVDDIAGLKIRAPDKLLEATWRQLGANPVPLPFPEVFNAVQQGVIDGDANPLASIVTFKWYEAARYVSLTNTAVGVGVLLIAEPFFQSLPEEHQALVIEAGQIATEANRKSEARLNAESEAFLRNEGVQIDTPELAPFREKLTPLFEDARARFGEDLLDRIAAIQNSC